MLNSFFLEGPIMPKAYAVVNKGQILAEYPWNQLSIFAKKETAEYLLEDIKRKIPEAHIVEVSIDVANAVHLPDWAQ